MGLKAFFPFFRRSSISRIKNSVNSVELHFPDSTIFLRSELIEVCQRLIWRAIPSHVSAPGEEHNLICEHHVLGGVCYEHNCAPLICESTQKLHQRGFRARIQTRSCLVQEEKTRFGQKFDSDGYSLLLTTAQSADLHIFPVSQVEII